MTNNKFFYDEVDMSHNYRAGFWIGTVAGAGSMFVFCLVAGLFLST